MLEYPKTKYRSSESSPLTQVVKAGNFYFISGQIPQNYETKEIVGNTMEDQAEQVMKNIGSMLESLELDFTDVAKTTCYLSDFSKVGEFNAVYKKYFVDKPSRVCLEVKTLPSNVLCEVECIAYKE